MPLNKSDEEIVNLLRRGQTRGFANARPNDVDRGLQMGKPITSDAWVESLRARGYVPDFRSDAPRQIAQQPAQQPAHRPPVRRAPQVLGAGPVSIDLNGTPYTAREHGARDQNISITRVRPFDPLTENGVALTNTQARRLHVRVGDVVTIRDSQTGATYRATYYDNAGNRPGAGNVAHFEVNPALADALGVNYRRGGRVVDAVTNSDQVDGRFRIER